jgi:pyridoxine 5-phosphate synthase
MIALSVNLNKIALIRNSRDTTNPNIPQHAQMCIDAGANGREPDDRTAQN